MALLEERGLLDRAHRGPAGRRRDGRAAALRPRASSGPELAVLLAYAKRCVARDARAPRTSATDPWLERDLRAYFPPAVVERCGAPARRAPAAARSCSCMANANSVVNALGPTFVSQLVAERGADAGRGRARLPDRASR